jgi:hypothetical protein
MPATATEVRNIAEEAVLEISAQVAARLTRHDDLNQWIQLLDAYIDFKPVNAFASCLFANGAPRIRLGWENLLNYVN